MSKKRVVITGASDGIGREIARRLRDDYQLVLCGRDQARLEAVAKDCGDAEHYSFDLNDAGSRTQAVDAMLQNGAVDILINNAGIWHKMDSLQNIDENIIHEVISTNLTSQIVLTKLLLPSIQGQRGKIINIVSKSGITAQEGQSVYSASKWGLRGFTDVLRNDLKESGVRVGAIYQSGTNTKLFEKTGEDFSTEKFSAPEDIADAVAYMLNSPANMWINEMRIEK